MSEAPATTEPTGTEPSAAATTPPEAPAPTPSPDISGWQEGKDPELTTDNASKVIAAIRADFKAEREKLRTAANSAAESARSELAQTIGKALGIVEDGAETDPAKLTESLTASQAEAKQARVELAVFRNAATAGGDPAALLDSSSFLKSLAAVDPSDSAAITAAIGAAIEANPRLGAAPAGPKPPAPNPAQGSSATGAPVQRAGSLGEALQKRYNEARQ